MDIAVVWDNARGRGDWSIAAGDILLGSALESAVAVSLFSDAIEGWWADAYATLPIGSRLDELLRAIKSGGTNVLLDAKNICNNALSWLISDGIAASVTTSCSWLAPQAIAIAIQIVEPSGAASSIAYSLFWNEL